MFRNFFSFYKIKCMFFKNKKVKQFTAEKPSFVSKKTDDEVYFVLSFTEQIQKYGVMFGSTCFPNVIRDSNL